MINIYLMCYIFISQVLALSILVVNAFSNVFEATFYSYVRFIILFIAALYFYMLPNRTCFFGKESSSRKINTITSKIVGIIAATINICILLVFYFKM